MNEKIKELVERAPYTTVSTEGRLFTQQDLAKFAESVISECIQVCISKVNKLNNQGHNKEAFGAFSASIAIRRHFDYNMFDEKIINEFTGDEEYR